MADWRIKGPSFEAETGGDEAEPMFEISLYDGGAGGKFTPVEAYRFGRALMGRSEEYIVISPLWTKPEENRKEK